MSFVEDSDRFCPRCGKRMMLELGQEDVAESFIGWVLMTHSCWSCNYTETDRQWRRPRLRVVGTPTAAERLKELRLGRVIPLRYDTTPFPKSELDEEESHVG
jgi:C4-type Zn-finger protein